ncbi:lactococcin 972 family bacteriocin [Nocardiopsis metallicus]|uniref:Lactococcin 972 family bacteriocin n=1 Tax=Nocardiopsis metallicus TaxID=179819 RepID=A0A840WRD7_9ACTN|nr:lactococcin 972 family bacteriocin [Nocardiopsis metallicus]MBB5494216.1 lactococcin 972 family bacteriocin [Nocardiopsis metallicus]
MNEVAKRCVAAALLAAGLTAGAAGTALAGTQIGGGTWYHGTTSSSVYSNYYHARNCHGSTAVGAYTDRSRNTAPGLTSYASAPKAWTNNQTYYRSGC